MDDKHPFKTLHCTGCGDSLRVQLGCGDRTCHECRRKWFGFHFNVLVDCVNSWKNVYFLTLTIKNIPEIGRSDIKDLRKWFRELLARFPQIADGFYVIQATNRGKGWHPHLHALYDGVFIPKEDLSKAWAEITGGSFIVDIQRPENPRKAVRYLLSDFLQAPRIRLEDVADFNGVFKGSRMIQAFGKYRRFKFRRAPYKCPKCGGTCWLMLDLCFGERRAPGQVYEDDT